MSSKRETLYRAVQVLGNMMGTELELRHHEVDSGVSMITTKGGEYKVFGDKWNTTGELIDLVVFATTALKANQNRAMPVTVVTIFDIDGVNVIGNMMVYPGHIEVGAAKLRALRDQANEFLDNEKYPVHLRATLAESAYQLETKVIHTTVSAWKNQ